MVNILGLGRAGNGEVKAWYVWMHSIKEQTNKQTKIREL